MSNTDRKLGPPCPKCGSRPTFRSELTESKRTLWVQCRCGFRGAPTTESSEARSISELNKELRKHEAKAVKLWKTAIFDYRLEELGLRKASGIEYREEDR